METLRLTFRSGFSPSNIMLLRDVLLPLGLFLVFLPFPKEWIVSAFTIVAYGHVNMALLYQYRAGKMNRWYCIVAFVLVALGVAYFVFYGDPVPVYLLTVVTFGLHGAIDEFYLHGEFLDWWKGITVACFTALFSAVSFLPYSSSFGVVAIGAGIVGAAAVFARLILERRLPSRTEWYLWYVAGLLVIFLYGAGVYTALGILSLIHFINWYIAYGMKTGGTPRAARYWKEVLFFTVFSFGLFTLYKNGVWLLKYLYDPVYYAAWAILHFILSSRFVSGEKRPLVPASS